MGFKADESVGGVSAAEWETVVASARRLIVGGGGLLNIGFFAEAFEKLKELRHPDSKLILWGAGHNGDAAGRYKFPKPSYTTDLTKFDLIGVRDHGHDFDWVPCVSCMSAAFDQHYPVRHKIVVYSHEFNTLELDYLSALPSNLPRLKNNASLKQAVEFIGSGDLVLTDCYHGAYWATLLGRRVIAFPRTSKFYDLKHPVPLCEPQDWRRYISMSTIYPNALADCRVRNVAFFNKVKALHVAEHS